MHLKSARIFVVLLLKLWKNGKAFESNPLDGVEEETGFWSWRHNAE
jgi:hypothetical protein